MPVDNSSIILTTQSIERGKDTGYPKENGLLIISESFVEFLEFYERQTHQETAIPGKDAAVSQASEAAVLHCPQHSTSNGEIK